MLRRISKKIFSKVFIERLKLINESIDKALLNIASKFFFLSIVYYTLWDSTFWREMRSVVLARRRYFTAKIGKEPSSYLLRRNIHRLEKGLIMKPRRKVFGERYIQETVDYFVLCLQRKILTSRKLPTRKLVLLLLKLKQ